jgi:16S rRNA (guanine527-N7)-methyltransferase
MATPETAILETTAAWGIPLSAAQVGQFATYAAELQAWNQRCNLTSITETRAIYIRHFLDSLCCVAWWGDAPHSLVDIGTGAGFPGLALKIAFPALRLTLVESVGKKVAFLQHMVDRLALENVTLLNERAELLGHMAEHREQYDVATARAVAELRVLAEYCLPLVRCGGRVLAPKGPAAAMEAADSRRVLATLGGALLSVAPVELPGEPPRNLIVVGKVAATPSRYPRAVGVPARRPLL